MLVLSDDQPQLEVPWLTYAVIGLCLAVFALQKAADYQGLAIVLKYGCVPAIVSGQLPYGGDIGHLHGILTLLSSAFLHGSWMHLGGNMLFLWVFGKHVEDSFGKFIYLAFIVICAICASLAQVFSNPATNVPGIGASGFISGIMGAYLILFPMAKLNVPLWSILGPWAIRFGAGMVRVPAFMVLGLWIMEQFVFVGRSDGIAYWAHIGGFASGALGGLLLRRGGIAATYAPETPGQ